MSEHPPIPEDAWDEMAEAICGGGEEPNAVHVRHLDMLNDVIGSVAPILWREWTRGMAVVPLPEPDRSGFIWDVEDDEEIHALRGNVVAIQTGDQWAYFPAAVARRRGLATLAAADRAEQLAAEAEAVQP